MPESAKLSSIKSKAMVEPFTIEDTLLGSSRCPNHSSPGLDGIPCEILHIIMKHRGITPLLLRVYNDALTLGIMPASWKKTCIILLPKKGDLTQLKKNHRPISLINSDAKVFFQTPLSQSYLFYS
jgi:hypothetical protein